jgi:predicted PurR-regulated permease PerM
VHILDGEFWRLRGKVLFWLAMGAIYIALFLPFWKPILLGWIFALAVMPLVERLRRRLKIPRVRTAYGLVTGFVSFAIVALILVVVHLYSTAIGAIRQPETREGITEGWQAIRDQIIAWVANTRVLPSGQIRKQVERTLSTVSDEAKEFAGRMAQEIVRSAPDVLLKSLIFFLAFGVFVIGGAHILRLICTQLGVKTISDEQARDLKAICGRSLASIFLVGLLQSTVASGGAALAGYESWATVFIFTFILSLIPVIGGGTVPASLCLFAVMQGDGRSAVILFVTTVIVGTSDNVLRAWLFSRAAKIHPVISLVSLLGALKVFGVIGLILAPVIEQLVMFHFFSAEDRTPS